MRKEMALTLLPKPTNRPPREIDPDAFDLRIEFQRVLAHLASVARLLVTTKRRSRIRHVVGIDPDSAGFDRAREAMGPRDVARPDAGRQTVDCVVGLTQQL